MSSFLQSIDQFGIEEKVLFQRSISSKKSVFGGIMTLLIYGITLSYFLYQFIDWIHNNKLPKVTSTSKQINHSETIQAKGKFLEICYFQKLKNQIDPFNPTSIIYYPTLILNPLNIEIQNIVFEQEITQDGKIINKIVLYDIELVGSPLQSQQLNQKDYQISFKRCNSENLQDGMYCANEAIYNQYQEQQNQFQIQIYIEQFNIKTKQPDKIPKFYVLNMFQNSLMFYNFQLECSLVSIDDGYLFPNSGKKSFFYNLYQLIQEFDAEYSKKYFNKDISMILFLTLDQIKTETLYEYPKISEILAEQDLQQVGNLVQLVNEYIKYQYRSNINVLQRFQKFIIKKKLVWKNYQYIFQEKSCDQQKMQKLLNKLQELAKQKLDFKTILQELSKIQQVLVLLLGQEKIKQLLIKPSKLESLLINITYQNKKIFLIYLIKYFLKENHRMLLQIVKISQISNQLLNKNSNNTLNTQTEDKSQFVNIKENDQNKKIDSKIFPIGNSSSFQ